MGIEAATYISQLVASNPLGTDQRSTSDDHHRLVKAVLQSQFPNFSASAVDSTVTELNLLSGYTGAIPEVGTAQEWTAQQNFDMASLTDAATITWDLNVAQVASVTLAGNRTLAAPTNIKAGGTYILIVNQDGVGGHTLTFNSKYEFAGAINPIVAAGIADISVLSFVSDGNAMYGSYLLDLG